MSHETEVVPESTAMTTVGGADTGNILAVIARAAADPQVDVTKMERLFALQERMLARQAEEAFNRAMSDCQAEMPKVLRDATNPSTNSRYARLESLNKAAIPVYTRHGFSLSFGSADCPTVDYHRITCVVSHKGGHTRNYQVDLPRDDMGAKGNQNKTKMHGAGSTFSYGRRYLTLLIFNISLVNEDDDGNGQNERPKPRGPMSEPPGQTRTQTQQKPAEGQPATAAGQFDDRANKKTLAELTKSIHHCNPDASGKIKLDNAGLAALGQYLLDENFITDTEKVGELSSARLNEVVTKLQAKLRA